jgi:hypothetical protein
MVGAAGLATKFAFFQTGGENRYHKHQNCQFQKQAGMNRNWNQFLAHSMYGAFVGSNPNARIRRVRTYLRVPSLALLDKIKAPVSFACRMAGLTNCWFKVSPAVTICFWERSVSYGAGGSSSLDRSGDVHSGSLYRNLPQIQKVAMVPPTSTVIQYESSKNILQERGGICEKLLTAPRYA